MRAFLAATATAVLCFSAPLAAKDHDMPSDKAQFGQDKAAAAIAKNDDKSMKASSSSKSSTTKASTTKPTNGTTTKPKS